MSYEGANSEQYVPNICQLIFKYPIYPFMYPFYEKHLRQHWSLNKNKNNKQYKHAVDWQLSSLFWEKPQQQKVEI